MKEETTKYASPSFLRFVLWCALGIVVGFALGFADWPSWANEPLGDGDRPRFGLVVSLAGGLVLGLLGGTGLAWMTVFRLGSLFGCLYGVASGASIGYLFRLEALGAEGWVAIVGQQGALLGGVAAMWTGIFGGAARVYRRHLRDLWIVQPMEPSPDPQVRNCAAGPGWHKHRSYWLGEALKISVAVGAAPLLVLLAAMRQWLLAGLWIVGAYFLIKAGVRLSVLGQRHASGASSILATSSMSMKGQAGGNSPEA